MGDEWLGGLGGGLDALAQILAQRKAERLHAEAVKEQIRQFNVRTGETAREHTAREVENQRWHDLLGQQRQDRLTAEDQARREARATNIVTGETPPGYEVSPEEAADIRGLGHVGAVRTTAATKGGPPVILPPGMLTPEVPGTLGALPGGLMPNPPQPERHTLPAGGFAYQRREADRAAAEAKAAEAQQAREEEARQRREPKPFFRASRNTGVPEQTGVVPYNAIVREEPPIKETTTADQARLDRSYQFTSKALETLRKPVAERQERLSRLALTLRQATPQADALVAPELLTAMAGGQGSGLRMNEAEIARIVGGRSALENLRASLQHLSLDPAKANSLTPSQRQQAWSLVNAMTDRTTKASTAIDEAEAAMLEAGDVNAHRRALQGVRQKLQAIDAAIAKPTGGPTGQSSAADWLKTLDQGR